MDGDGVWYVFFFNDTATTEIYTLSLHDALPICDDVGFILELEYAGLFTINVDDDAKSAVLMIECPRSEEHTSELQSLVNLVCRLLLEKKNYSEPLLTL